MSDFTVSARMAGRPDRELEPRERECYDLLDRLGVAYERVEFNRQPETTAEAEELDAAIGVPGMKNLVFQNRNKSRTLFFVLPRDKRFDAKAFAKAREITRLSMVNAAALEELLHTHTGAVGVMELMYDMEGKLELFLDRELLGWEYLRFPPNAGGTLLRVRTADFLEKILPAVGHGYTALEEDDACFGLPEAEFQFRPLRRSRQALSREEAAAILSRHTHGVLALAGDGGYPYAVPMSYAYRDGKLYFHSARAGHKIDSLTRSAKVSFCVVDADEVVPEEYTTYFRSAIAFGKARVLTDPAEMRKGLELLGERYRPGHPAERAAEIEREFAAVAVIEMEIEHLSGKEAIELVNKREKK